MKVMSLAALFIFLSVSACSTEQKVPDEYEAPKAAAHRPPSALLIVVDTLRADHLGCYGYSRPTSPNIDRFASEAILFENAISVSAWTTPAVAAMLTSRYPREVCWKDNPPVPIDPGVARLPQIFKANGYATGAIVAHIFLGMQLGFHLGFDLFDQENIKGHYSISSPSVTDKSIAFADTHKEKSFFLFSHYFDPHFDYLLHEKYNFFPDYKGTLKSGLMYPELLKLVPGFGEDDLKYIIALYDSEIAFTDEHIGRLLDHLKKIGVYDDMLIVLVGDHGEEFCDRGGHYIGHTIHLHEELTHVPLIIKPPKWKGERRVSELVSSIDLMPTILKEVGLEMPRIPKVRGRALNLAAGRELGGTDIFSDSGGDQAAIIDGGWKLMQDKAGEDLRYSLFDLRADPFEKKDVSSQYPDELARLREKMNEKLESLAAETASRHVVPIQFSPEEIEKLKAMGYLRPRQ